MTDAQQIVCFLAAYYLAECLYWARAGSVVFVSQVGERHRPRTPFQSVGLCNQHGGLIPGNLLPWGDSTLGQVWPFSVSPDRVVAVAPSSAPDGPPETTGVHRAWSELGSLAVDQAALTLDDAPFAWAASPELATTHADFLRRLAAAPRDEREALIDRALAANFDAHAAAERLAVARRATRGLRVCCAILFSYVFVAFPIVAFAELPIAVAFVVLGYLPLLATTLVVFAATHRTLFPNDGAGQWKQLLMMAVSPADATHARDALIRRTLESYQPLALAAALCPPATFERFARSVLLDLRHPPPSVATPADPDAAAAAEWFRDRFAAAVRECVARAGLDPERLVAPPEPEGPEVAAYCPRCHGQYVRSGGRCNTCELPLIPFAAAVASS